MYKRLLLLAIALPTFFTGSAIAESGKEIRVAQVVPDVMNRRRPVVRPTSAADPLVAKYLRQIGLRYKITSSGWYKVTLKTKNGRTQVVRISSKRYKYEKTYARHVCSVGLKTYGMPNARIAYRLLKENGSVKMGNWGILKLKNSNYWMADFCAKMLPGQGAAVLRDYIKMVMFRADQTERELTGRDAY